MAVHNGVVAVGMLDVVVFGDGTVQLAVSELTEIRSIEDPLYDTYLPGRRVRKACEDAAQEVAEAGSNTHIPKSEAFMALLRIYRLAGGEGGLLDPRGRPDARRGEGDEKR